MAKKKKKAYQAKISEEAEAEALKNPYTNMVFQGKIDYSDEFYIDLFEQLEQGKTATEAYSALGYNVEILGRNRADQAAKRARQKAKNGTLYACRTFNGDKTREEMGEMTPEEEIQWLKNRNLFLEVMIDYEKKVGNCWQRKILL